jgi:hypothetical protein
MSLLIPGPKFPAMDFDLFLQPLIEELITLWGGVETHDAVSIEPFNMRAVVLYSINDFPALGTVSGRVTKGYYACTHCDKNPLSRVIRNKICYIGHRRYLPMDHAWRRIRRRFDGKEEFQEKPEKFTPQEVARELDRVKDVCPGLHKVGQKRKRGEYDGSRKNSLIYKRMSAWWDLPYWGELLLPPQS